MRLTTQARYRLQGLERMSREELLALQLRKLQYQVGYLYAHNPYYRRRFQEHGVRPEDIKTREDIQRLPFTTKADLLKDQTEHPPYGSRLGVATEEVVQTYLTSGTSGLGQEVYGVTQEDLEASGRIWSLHLHWAGLRKGDAAYMMLPVGTNAGALTTIQGYVTVGSNVFLTGAYDSRTKLQYMQRFKPHHFMTANAYLTHLTILCQETGIEPRKDFATLKGIVVAGEPYSEDWAMRMEDFWGTTVHEFYGSTQQGSIAAATCELGVVPEGKRGALHAFMDTSFFEIIDPETERQVAPGETGELVVTTLYRQGSPLVRFRTKDRVTYLPHNYCACGRNFDIWEPGTIARYDDMMKIKGTNVWPETVDRVVFGCPEVEEYSGKVTIDDRGREEVILSLEFKNRGYPEDMKAAILKKIGHGIKERVGISVTIKEVPFGTLERFTFKVRRWTDERRERLDRVTYGISGVKAT